MRKLKKLLCVLLVYALLAGSLAVGASAYADYSTPAGFNTIGKPRYTYEQTCSMLLDFLDKTLYEANIVTEVDAVVTTLRVNLTSVDNTFQSLTDILNNGWVGFAQFLGAVGDLRNLNGDAIENPRRSNSADSTVFYALLQFLRDNRGPVASVVNGSFNWGLIDNFLTDAPYLYDTANYLKTLLCNLLYNKVLKPEGAPDQTELPAGTTIDGELQKVIDKLFVGDYNVSTQSYTGFLPGMRGNTSITTGSFYDFVQNCIDAAMNDLAVPALVDTLVDALDIQVSEEWPNGNPEESGLLGTVVGIINDYLELGYDYDTEEYPVIELEKLLTWMLVGSTTEGEGGETVQNGAAIYNIISFTDHGVDINDALLENIRTLLRSLGPGLLQQFLPEYFPEDMEFEDLTNYNTDQFIAYLFKLLIPHFLPDVRILPNCDTIQECLTYLLISLVIDILPENDYYGQIADGTLDPENGAWIEVGTDYLIHLMNSIIDVNMSADLSFEQMLDALIEWAVNNYGFIFNTRLNYSSMSCWEKLDNTIFSIVDPSWLTITVAPGDSVSRTLIMDYILGGVQTLDIEKILGFIGKSANPNAEFYSPVLDVVIALVARVLKSLMNGNDIIPNVNRLDTLIAGENGRYLGEFVSNLLYYLYEEKDYNFPTIIPLVGTLIGLSQNDNFTIYAPIDYPNKTINDLKVIMEEYIPSNEGLKYNDAGYVTIGEEDYEHFYEFEVFENTYEDCQELIENYTKNQFSVTPTDIKNLYYRLSYYYNQLTERSTICKTQLSRELEYAASNIPTENIAPDGESLLYTQRSWRLYQEAIAFANSVMNSNTVNQSTISSARQQLFRAGNALKSFIRLARYNALDARIAAAQQINPNDYKLYTTGTIVEFASALDYAVNLDRDYDADDQSIVDAATARLAAALANLEFWQLNYELGADIVIDSVVAQDASTVLKFRESSGAAVTNVSATVNNGAQIGQMYTEGDYSCWVITPGSAPLYSVITASINFTQPSTGMNYTAYAYTFVTSGTYQVGINVNTCQVNYVRNVYNVSLTGIDNASAMVTSYNIEHTNAGFAGEQATVPTGMVYVDVSRYTDISEIPGLAFTITKDASSYGSGYIGTGTFISSTLDNVTSSEEGITISQTSKSFNLNQTDYARITFAGAVPPAGESIETNIKAVMTLTATNGGVTTSHPQFNLRVTAYDKSILRANVNDAVASCRQEWFYSGGWSIYRRDLENAVRVLNNPIVTQAEIDEANENLLEAISWLEYKSADYKELHKLFSIVSTLDPNDYLDFSSIYNILESIDYDKGILEQSQVDELVTNLRAAIDGLNPAQGQITILCYDNSGLLITEQSEVSVSANENTTTLLDTDSIIGNVGEKVIINVPQILGYTSEDTEQLATITKEGVVVSFYYTPDTYRIIFNANGGTVDTPTKYVTFGQTYSDLPVPVREGYVFTGWYNKLSDGIRVGDQTKVTTSCYRTLYAHWEEAPDTQSADVQTQSTTEAPAADDGIQGLFKTISDAIMKLINFILANVFGVAYLF